MFLDCYPPYSLFNFFPIKYSLLVTSFVYHYSSIVNEAIRAISSLFIFFLREHFATQKTHKKKPTNKTKISEKKTTKATIFARKNFIWEDNLFIWRFFFRLKFLIKKFEIILIASFTRLLECAPLNLPMENLFACSYFYL